MSASQEDIQQAVIAILGADEDQCNLLSKALQQRFQLLSTARSMLTLAEVYLGDTVTLTNISPKFLDGARGVVEAIDGQKAQITVRLTPQVRDRRVTTVPASCVRKIV